MKVMHVDFENQKLESVENIEIKPKDEIDPVLRRIRKKLDPQWWETYKRTIEHYWDECFEYQMEEMNGMLYDPEEAARWEETHGNKI